MLTYLSEISLSLAASLRYQFIFETFNGTLSKHLQSLLYIRPQIKTFIDD